MPLIIFLHIFACILTFIHTNNLIHQAACWLNTLDFHFYHKAVTFVASLISDIANLKLKHFTCFYYILPCAKSNSALANLEIPLSAFCWAGTRKATQYRLFEKSHISRSKTTGHTLRNCLPLVQGDKVQHWAIYFLIEWSLQVHGVYRGRCECQKAVSRAAMLVEMSGSARQASKNSDSVTTPSLLPSIFWNK